MNEKALAIQTDLLNLIRQRDDIDILIKKKKEELEQITTTSLKATEVAKGIFSFRKFKRTPGGV